MYSKLFFLSFILIICSCGNPQSNQSITIGTFNIQWLGDGINDKVKRSEGDYQRIAQSIEDTGAEIIALQEVENEAALNRILKYLDGWNYIFEKDDYILNLAFIAKNDIKLESIGLYSPLKVLEGKSRSGLIAKAQKGNFDFYIMNLHFKSTSRYDNTAQKKELSHFLRKQQSDVLSAWVDSVLVYKEQDLIILGDFNDNPKRDWSDNLNSLIQNNNINFISSNLESCKNPNWDNIDHILLSKSALKRYLMGSVGMYNINSTMPDKQAKLVSDHCPVTAIFNIAADDND
ncbi:hypothetical protein OAQ99_01135 [Candidatus Kapabacteria bacterium]|nr:hypothetical protein [Candidatus Kapabacteria bacterium]